jgi:hypothetical protein
LAHITLGADAHWYNGFRHRNIWAISGHAGRP